MTNISEVLASIKRSNLTIEELTREVEQSLKATAKGLEDLNRPLEELAVNERKINEEISKYDSNNLTLSKEISNLKEEKGHNEILLTNTQNQLNDTTQNRAKTETKIRETKTILSDTTSKLEVTKNELAGLEQENAKLLVEIENIVKTSDQQLLEFGKKAEQKRDSIRKSKGERMALEYLIKKNHVEFNEIKIINSLEGRKNTDMATVSKVTGLSSNLIEKTLNGLMKRKLLEYDSATGAITIIGNLKI
ncbi:MAG: hypothetical protein ACFFDW_03520 [Candidatus Thorarchaeota archaeon]